MPWRCWAHKSNLAPPALICWMSWRCPSSNFIVCHNVFPVCSWWVELVHDSGRVIIKLLQDMTEPTNLTVDALMNGPLAEILIGHKIEPLHLLGDPDSAGLEAMDMWGVLLTYSITWRTMELWIHNLMCHERSFCWHLINVINKQNKLTLILLLF